MITIPILTGSCFRGLHAAAIEAVGSTGGQLMPPIMGAAAFLMAEVLQVPYAEVMIAAIIPAFLYYLALFFQVDVEAAKRGISGEPRERLPQLAAVLKSGWYFPLPFVALVYALVGLNWQAEYAALAATGVLIALSMIFGYKGARVPLRQMIVAVVSTGACSRMADGTSRIRPAARAWREPRPLVREVRGDRGDRDSARGRGLGSRRPRERRSRRREREFQNCSF